MVVLPCLPGSEFAVLELRVVIQIFARVCLVDVMVVLPCLPGSEFAVLELETVTLQRLASPHMLGNGKGPKAQVDHHTSTEDRRPPPFLYVVRWKRLPRQPIVEAD